MLAIKLKRIGKKKQASFRVVVSERRSKLNGRFVEDLGWANPRTDTFNIVKDRILHWIGVGAKPTDTVHNLLVRAGVVKGPKVAVHKKSKKQNATSERAVPKSAETQGGMNAGVAPVAEAAQTTEAATPVPATESVLEPTAEIAPAQEFPAS